MMTTKMTLAQMTECMTEELRVIAVKSDCRFYATACNQIAAAMDALAMGDRKIAATHLERAKTAHARCMEVEADRIKRCVRDLSNRGQLIDV